MRRRANGSSVGATENRAPASSGTRNASRSARNDGVAGPFLCTTRGSFTSPTAKLVNEEMLPRLVEAGDWHRTFPRTHTALVEVIHPSTRVHRVYRGSPRVILIGATSNFTLDEYNISALRGLGRMLGVPVTKTRRFRSIEELREHMKDRSVTNKEGWVARNGTLRVKFKYETYIGKMVASKLTYTYLMNRIMSGNLDEMLSTLDEELYDAARKMVSELRYVRRMRRPLKGRWEHLYGLVPEGEATPYYKQVCRRYVKHQCGG